MEKWNVEDIIVRTENFNCNIRLKKYSQNAEKAQKWLENEIVDKMLPVMPFRTGNLVGMVQSVNSILNGSGRVRAAQGYGVKLYTGISPSGTPWRWTNPRTQPYWGRWVLQTYGPELKAGVNRILKGDGKNG